MVSTRLKHLLVFLMLLMSGQATFGALPRLKVNYSAKSLVLRLARLDASRRMVTTLNGRDQTIVPAL